MAVYLPPDRVTVGTFYRNVKGKRRGAADNWVVVAADVRMYLTPRRPSSQTSRPEVQFDDMVAYESQWFWARLEEVNNDLRIGHRLERQGKRDLFITQNDILGHVQQLLLSDSGQSA